MDQPETFLTGAGVFPAYRVDQVALRTDNSLRQVDMAVVVIVRALRYRGKDRRIESEHAAASLARANKCIAHPVIVILVESCSLDGDRIRSPFELRHRQLGAASRSAIIGEINA